MPGIHVRKNPPEDLRDNLSAHQERVYVSVFNSMLRDKNKYGYTNGQIYATAMSEAKKAPREGSKSMYGRRAHRRPYISGRRYIKQADLKTSYITTARKSVLKALQDMQLAEVEFEDLRYTSDTMENGHANIPRIIRAQKLLSRAIDLQEEVNDIMSQIPRELRGEQISEV